MKNEQNSKTNVDNDNSKNYVLQYVLYKKCISTDRSAQVGQHNGNHQWTVLNAVRNFSKSMVFAHVIFHTLLEKGRIKRLVG